MNTASVQDRSSASLWVYAGLAVVATAGFFYVNIMAAIVDGLIAGLGFSNAQAGSVGAANIYGASIGSFIAVFLVRRVQWRPVLFALISLLLVLDLGSLALRDPTMMMVVRALHGVVGGLAVGVVSALRPGSWFDHLVSVAVFAAMSFPTFFLCLLLIKWFAVDLHWLPVGGMTNTGSDESGWQYVLQVAAHLALPVLALVMLQAGSLTRYVRASMLDVVTMDFIRTARAKGLQERTVILKHALRNALLPIITLLGFELPGLFSGAIITEKVFNWPGAGHIHIDSLAARDYPVLMGFTLFLAVLTIVGNLLADVLYAWADPRIRVRS